MTIFVRIRFIAFVYRSCRELQENAKNLTLSTYSHTPIGNFKQLIEENYTSLKLPKQYAALLYITSNHLNAVCNDSLGMSAEN